jgi:hypothetical protein
LGNARPDVFAFNPDAGVAVYTICDWVPGSPVRRYDSDALAIVAETRGGGWMPVSNPMGQVNVHREALEEIFDVGEPVRSKITAGIVMTGFPVADANRLLGGVIRNDEKNFQGHKFLRVIGREQLENGDIEAFLPAAFEAGRQCQLSEGAVERIRDWIGPSTDREMIPGDLLVLDRRQRELVQNRTNRRIKGPAGTGKSAVLAAAAVEAALTGRKVLMVVKTITLRHYLWDLATRWLPEGTSKKQVAQAMRDNVTIYYLHEWVRHTCVDAGLEKRLRMLPMFPYPEKELKALVSEALPSRDSEDGHQTGVKLYDTVLIDEAQNIDADWWQLLLRTRRGEDAELMLAADLTQSLYGDQATLSSGQNWTDEPTAGGGFRGPWVSFSESYRFPENIVPMLADYCDRFLDGDEVDKPTTSRELDLFSCQMRYRDVRASGDLATEVAELIHQWSDLPDLPSGDIAFLMSTHSLGLEVIEHLKFLNPDLAERVTHVFGEGWPVRQQRKRAFRRDPLHFMGSTLHSFQGWESRCVIFGIPPLHDGADPGNEFNTAYWKAVYVGLSRVTRSAAGSFLVVVNAELRLDDFLQKHFVPV